MNGDTFVVAVDGLSALRSMESIPADVKRAAVQAINKAADRGRTDAARRIREQVNLPASYLAPSGGRLTVTKRATGADLEAAITGRQRPTSLARFAVSGVPNEHKGISVEVAPGFAKFMRRAFLIRLRAGSANLDTNSNLGLAIRLRPGEVIHNKRVMMKLSGNLYLLYGPSVNQIFASVAQEEAPELADFLEAEFLRLMDLDGSGTLQ